MSDAEHAAAVLSVAGEQARALERTFAELASRLARGTSDVTEAAKTASKPEISEDSRHVDLRTSVQALLRRESLSLSQVARATGEPSARVSAVLRQLRQEKLVHNVGGAEHPIWSLRIGDHTTTTELGALVRRLVSERPMTTRELTDATGARMSRVGGCLVHLQRTDRQLVNLGTPRQARWFLVSDRARTAHLEPKRNS